MHVLFWWRGPTGISSVFSTSGRTPAHLAHLRSAFHLWLSWAYKCTEISSTYFHFLRTKDGKFLCKWLNLLIWMCFYSINECNILFSTSYKQFIQVNNKFTDIILKITCFKEFSIVYPIFGYGLSVKNIIIEIILLSNLNIGKGYFTNKYFSVVYLIFVF